MELKKLSTITDALEYLTEKTGRLWTDSDLLQTAMNCYPPLQAHPDKIAPVVEKLYVGHTPMTEVCTKEIPWEMAILGSDEIVQLASCGTTYAKYANGNNECVWTKLSEECNPLDLNEMEYWQTREFKTPVCVNTDMVRVPAEFILKIISGKVGWPINIQAAPASKVKVGTGTSQSGDDSNLPDTGNLAYWRAVLRSNIKKIDEHKKANVRGIIKYLRGLGDKRLPNQGTPDELFWIDDMGDTQCVQKKSVSNAASEARNLP